MEALDEGLTESEFAAAQMLLAAAKSALADADALSDPMKDGYGTTVSLIEANLGTAEAIRPRAESRGDGD